MPAPAAHGTCTTGVPAGSAPLELAVPTQKPFHGELMRPLAASKTYSWQPFALSTHAFKIAPVALE